MSMTLHLGDCLDVMRGMEAGSVDLILTSPPYDNLRKYAAGSAFDFEGVAAECKRLMRPGGVLVWVVGDQTKDGDESGTSFRQALHFKAIGLKLHDTMIYRKANPAPITQPRYQSEFEFMFVFGNGRPKTVNLLDEPCRTAGQRSGNSHRMNGNELIRMDGYGKRVGERKARGNIWAYGVGRVDSGHPAAFPLRLAIDHILSWTDPGDTVLDPFVGSGTTLAACIETGRFGIGIEKAPEYHAIAANRIAAAREAAPLFPAG